MRVRLHGSNNLLAPEVSQKPKYIILTQLMPPVRRRRTSVRSTTHRRHAHIGSIYGIILHLIFQQDEIGSSAWRRKLLLPRTKPIYLQPIAQFKQTENKQGCGKRKKKKRKKKEQTDNA